MSEYKTAIVDGKEYELSKPEAGKDECKGCAFQASGTYPSLCVAGGYGELFECVGSGYVWQLKTPGEKS